MTDKKRKVLMTSGLLYANGDLHLGHMVEAIQSDIFCRALNLLGHECIYVCGDDAHGTPIMLKAQQTNQDPETLIAEVHQRHIADFQDFQINTANYYTTHSAENKALTELIYQRLEEAGHITKKNIQQAYDPVKEMFLPDRYVKGECPKCQAIDQYGDSCEQCGAHYSPTELKNPTSVISGATPIQKESLHYFFCLDHFEDQLKAWTKAGHLQPEIAKKLDEWFETGLQQWDISRDAPYFGFQIPGSDNKYFYVWLDAPIGYFASFKNWCEKTKSHDFFATLKPDSDFELIHFIGKDIVYFHALFWPAMLSGSQFKQPDQIYVHGFLTVNGEKMSKSRGTFITARTYLNHLPADYLRYYFAAKLTEGIDDLDLNFEDFIQRVNSDLVGKFVNIASRCAGFIHKRFDGQLAAQCPDQVLFQQFVDQGVHIGELFAKRQYAKAIREIMALADAANRYIDEQKPWILIKSADTQQTAHEVCSLGVNLFRLLVTYLQPVIPTIAQHACQFLNVGTLDWNLRAKYLTNHQINVYEPLAQRIESKQVETMVEESKATESQSQKPALDPNSPLAKDPIKDTINIDDFVKLDLRVAKIIEAEHVPDANKLLRLVLDLGGEQRQVFAGIKAAYPEPEKLVGRLTVMVANLAPRKMRFGVSEGMVLAAGPGGEDIWILSPDTGAMPGMLIK